MTERAKAKNHPEKADERPPSKKPANVAPDAVKDPNERTDGKPGHGGSQGNETDPGGG